MLESLTHKTMTLATTLHTGLAEAGYWQKLWFRDSSSTKVGLDTDDVAMALWWICVGWFTLLMVLMFYFGFKYRRKAAGPAPRSSAHNTPLEVAWTVIPTLFLIWMFFAGYRGFIKKFVSPGDSVDMTVVSGKWYWSMTYPNGVESDETTVIGAKEIPIFYLPANTPIRVRMESKDVLHGFYVPDFRIKVDAMPNRYTYTWFEASGPNEGNPNTKKFASTEPEWKRNQPYADHWLFCSEYCGDEHSEMWAIIRIVPFEVYNGWLQEKMNGTPGKDPAIAGERIYKTKCASCHSVDGSKNTGPSWNQTFGNPAIPIEGGTTVVGDENYIKESIRTPAAKIHAGYPNQMTPWPPDVLSDQQIEKIIAYMKKVTTFKSSVPDAPAATPPATDPKSPPPSEQKK